MSPGVLGYLDGKPFSVITLEGGEGDAGTIIRAIYVVTNPESYRDCLAFLRSVERRFAPIRNRKIEQIPHSTFGYVQDDNSFPVTHVLLLRPSLMRTVSSLWFWRNHEDTTIAYWVATIFVACVMTISGGLALGNARGFVNGLAHFGYPPYFANLLGVGKIARGGCSSCATAGEIQGVGLRRFGIVAVSACYSYYQAGDKSLRALEPLVTGAALVVSYALRPADRRFAMAAPSEARVSV